MSSIIRQHSLDPKVIRGQLVNDLTKSPKISKRISNLFKLIDPQKLTYEKTKSKDEIKIGLQEIIIDLEKEKNDLDIHLSQLKKMHKNQKIKHEIQEKSNKQDELASQLQILNILRLFEEVSHYLGILYKRPITTESALRFYQQNKFIDETIKDLNKILKLIGVVTSNIHNQGQETVIKGMLEINTNIHKELQACLKEFRSSYVTTLEHEKYLKAIDPELLDLINGNI